MSHVAHACPPQEEAKLLVANAAKFKNWFNVDVKESTEVVAIDRAARKVGGCGARACWRSACDASQCRKPGGRPEAACWQHSLYMPCNVQAMPLAALCWGHAASRAAIGSSAPGLCMCCLACGITTCKLLLW